MKKLFSLFFGFLFTFSLFAGGSVTADGALNYVDDSGVLVTLPSTLEVPYKGEGSITLKNEMFTATTDNFWVKHEDGRTIFYILFKSNKGEEGKKLYLMKGTYLRGSNLALYQGDTYIKSYKSDKLIDAEISLIKFSTKGHNFKYMGSFNFSAPIVACPCAKDCPCNDHCEGACHGNCPCATTCGDGGSCPTTGHCDECTCDTTGECDGSCPCSTK